MNRQLTDYEKYLVDENIKEIQIARRLGDVLKITLLEYQFIELVEQIKNGEIN